MCKPAIFGSNWEPTFQVMNQFIFSRNAPIVQKPVLCWWKRPNRVIFGYSRQRFSAKKHVNVVKDLAAKKPG